VADLVDVRLQDYRDVRGEFDAVVSVEMIEAVGEKYWPTYFAALDAHLKPGGRVGLQSITMPHERMLATRRGYTWIHKYVFPGGIIPSLQAIEDNLAAHTSLSLAERRDLGPHYAHTLALWRERFLANWDRLEGAFDETFRRMWEFYLAYCEAGFRVGYLGVSQLGLARTPTW
jgi:cyclopropane-fatty-acyl-phospholipid synthase